MLTQPPTLKPAGTKNGDIPKRSRQWIGQQDCFCIADISNVTPCSYIELMFLTAQRKLNNLLPVGLSRPELIATLAECHRLAKHSEERCLAYTAAIDALGDHGADALLELVTTKSTGNGRSRAQSRSRWHGLRQ